MAADLTATVFLNAMLIAKDRLMAFERRRPDLGTYEVLDKYRNGVINEAAVADARKSARRPVEFPVRKRSTPTILTTRTISATPEGSQTAKVGMNWNTYGFAVGITQSINADNYLTAQEDLAGQIEDAMRVLLLRLDSDAVDFLEAGKYSSLPDSMLMGSPVGGAYRTNQKDFYFQVPAVMRKLEMMGPWHIVSNVEAIAGHIEKSTYGSNNAQNLEKLLAGYEFSYSPNIAPASTDIATHYVIPTGSLGTVSWIEDDCRRGVGSFEAGKKYYTMPISFTSLSGYNFTLEFGVVYVGATVDKSGVIPGLQRSWTEAWYPFFDLSFAKQYSSEAGKSSIVKYQLAA